MASAAEVISYSGHQTSRIVGISYRQLDYWARTDLIRPSIADAHGSGSQRLYSYADLVKLKLIKRMIDSGLSLQGVRGALDSLGRIDDESFDENQIVLIGNSKSVFARDGDDLVDLLKGNQMVFGMLLSLGDLQQELQAEIVSIANDLAKSDEQDLSPVKQLPHKQAR